MHDRRTVADLHDRLSYECYLTDDLDATRSTSGSRARRCTTSTATSNGWAPRSAGCRGCPGSSAAGEDARRYADQAIATLEGLPPGHELAMALSNKAQLAMLAGE